LRPKSSQNEADLTDGEANSADVEMIDSAAKTD
jgi:hypothetical protein